MITDFKVLLGDASGALEKAYSPYSKFKVGAAILTKSGKVFTGCNVENASYGLTVCAERVAVFKALSEGERDFEAMAVCSEGGAQPCGACRQVLHEFAPELRIILGDAHGTELSRNSLADLLPHAFGGGFKKT